MGKSPSFTKNRKALITNRPELAIVEIRESLTSSGLHADYSAQALMHL